VRRLKDIAMQCMGLAFALGAVALMTLGGLALGGVTARFGVVGWLVYAILMSGWLMFVVPLLMTAFELRQAGSARQRQAKELRVVEQRRRFGLRPPVGDRCDEHPDR
jgi:hypothetical protein